MDLYRDQLFYGSRYHSNKKRLQRNNLLGYNTGYASYTFKKMSKFIFLIILFTIFLF